MTNTPILFLVFNRPDTTRKVFEVIARAQPRQLFVASDGPRDRVHGEAEKCATVRDIASAVDWDCELKTLFRVHNLGCKNAISSAITWLFKHVDRGIILEDDCLPSDSFFPFCTELLDRYAYDERIMMISGNNFQNGFNQSNASYYFSRISHIWGWATWRRAWRWYEPDMPLIEDSLEQTVLQRIFPDSNVRLSWALAFLLARVNKLDTWDYPWQYTVFSNSGLSVVPEVNLVSNIGFGADGTHTTTALSPLSCLPRFDLPSLSHPQGIYCNEAADHYEYEQRNIYPLKEQMGLLYRIHRSKKQRALTRKINKLYTSKKIKATHEIS